MRRYNSFNKILFGLAMTLSSASATFAQRIPSETPTSQKEKLNRGLINISPSRTSQVLSWRLLDADDEHTSFLVLKNGKVVTDTIRTTTFKRIGGNRNDLLQLVTLQNGVPQDTIAPQVFNNTGYHLINLDLPEAGEDYTYTPSDCSVGDVDGDGEYELILKWDPSNGKDNSHDGITGKVYIDCYKIFSGEKLWRIDLGMNIRAGAHYTQFLVYDFDKDGRAELICKTAPGSIDGKGKYVSEAATLSAIKNVNNEADHRTAKCRINSGHEYLTVFEGLTGRAIHTIAYYPNRNNAATLSDAAGTFNWDTRAGKGDTGAYGNRGERYLACVAYLDGPEYRPSAVMCRGYYTYTNLWAVDFDGEKLTTKWLHKSINNSNVSVTDSCNKTTTRTYSTNTHPDSTIAAYTAFSQSAHSISVGDLDGDGKDEIMYGNAAVDDDGWMLYSTGLGHGDALHLGDFDPDRPGLECFMIHEAAPYGHNYRDAGTGEILVYSTSSGDNGRGVCADVLVKRGAEFWSANVANTYNIDGSVVSSNKPSMNYRIFWDGDEYEELLNSTSITKWSPSGSKTLGIYTINSSTEKSFSDLGLTPSSCNGTKATPCLQADILGDWREEVIWWNKNNPSQIYLVSTTATTKYRVPTLMHDHLYRMGIAWQNVGYNQPPHLGYYLPDYVKSFAGVPDEVCNGVLHLDHAQKTVKEQTYYNINGQQIKCAPSQRSMYIVKKIFDDNTTNIEKHIK